MTGNVHLHVSLNQYNRFTVIHLPDSRKPSSVIFGFVCHKWFFESCRLLKVLEGDEEKDVLQWSDVCCLFRPGRKTLRSICQWWVWMALYTQSGWRNQRIPESGEDLPVTISVICCFSLVYCNQKTNKQKNCLIY